jgi:hypothetical protein
VASNDYHFVTVWRIPATPEEITGILGDAPALARWWPSVYLTVAEAAPGDANGVGKVVRRRFTVTESQPPAGFKLEAEGDFVGRGIWTLRRETSPGDPDGPLTTVTYDWTVIAEKGILKNLSVIMKPIFRANHHWAMARGGESLKLELARRHAASDPTIHTAISAPPGPIFPRSLRRLGRA